MGAFHDINGNFEGIVYVATYKDVAMGAISIDRGAWKSSFAHEPHITIEWLNHFGKVHYDLHGENEIKCGLRPIERFDPYAYIAGYPGTLKSFWDETTGCLNTELSCFAYIYYGLPGNLERNRNNLCTRSAQDKLHICNMISNKRLVIMGNSPQLPHEIAHYVPLHNDVVVRFNNGAYKNARSTDIAVYNNVLLKDKFKRISRRLKCPIVCMQHGENVINLHVDLGGFQHNCCLTSGMLFLLWIANCTDTCYDHVLIAGFNMVEAGQRAHYYGRELVPYSNGKFLGHDAALETQMLQHLLNSSQYKMSRIV